MKSPSDEVRTEHNASDFAQHIAALLIGGGDTSPTTISECPSSTPTHLARFRTHGVIISPMTFTLAIRNSAGYHVNRVDLSLGPLAADTG